MNDPTSDPLDELASAHLDGETSPEEAARVARDPELTARVAAFEEVRSAIRSEVRADPGRRDAAIAGALGAFDDEAEAAGLGRGAGATPISAARRARLRWARAVGVAAAAVLVAAVVPVLLDRDDGGEDTAARAPAPALEDDASGDGAAGREDQAASTFDAGATAPGAGGGATGSAELSAGAPFDLGAHEDLRSLAEAARAALAREPDGPVPLGGEGLATGGPGDCLRRTMDALVADGSTTVELQATAAVDGVPVVVVVGRRPDGTRVLVVARSDEGCAEIAREQL